MIALVILIRIDPLITLVTFLPLCGVVLVTHWMRSRLPRLWGEARDATTGVTTLIADTFAGVQTVKAAGAEAAVMRKLAEVNRTRERAETRSLVAGACIDAVSQAAILTAQGLVLLIGAGAMLTGRLTVGDFVVFGIYLDWMLELPRRAGRTLGQAPSRPPAAPAAEEMHEFVADNLSFTDPGTRHGIANVSLRLRRGTITVIAGEVGAGKSTLLEVLLGLRDADAGRIRWNGRVVTAPAEVMRPPRVAYKSQAPRLFSDTLRDNILLGAAEDDERLRATLRNTALTTDLGQLSHGIDVPGRLPPPDGAAARRPGRHAGRAAG